MHYTCLLHDERHATMHGYRLPKNDQSAICRSNLEPHAMYKQLIINIPI